MQRSDIDIRQKTATHIYIAHEHRIYVPLHLLEQSSTAQVEPESFAD